MKLINNPPLTHILSSQISSYFIKIFVAISTIHIFYLVIAYQSGGTDDLATHSILGLFTAITSVILLRIHYKVHQYKSDRIVSECINDEEKNNGKPLILFLRPFATDGKLPIEQNPLLDALSVFFLLGINKAGGFETKLRSALGRTFNLVRLDEDFSAPFLTSPLTHIRTMFSYRIGRHVLPKVDWEQDCYNLIHKSFACIVVPPSSIDSSTSKEIRHMVKKGYLSKTIFIMPQSRLRIRTSKTKVTAKQLWENLYVVLGEKIILPDYDQTGGFVVYLEGQFKLILGFSGKPWHSKKCILKLFKGGTLTDPMLDSIRVSIKAGIIIPLISLLVSAGLYVYLERNFNIPDYDARLISVALVFIVAARYYYLYCHYFLLTKTHLWLLYISTIMACVIGFIVSNSMMTAMTGGWLPPYSDDIMISRDELFYLLSTLPIFILPTVLVFGSAYFIFTKRNKICFDISRKSTL